MAPRKKAPVGPVISPALQKIVDEVVPTPEMMDGLIGQHAHMALMRAIAGTSASDEIQTVAALQKLRAREGELEQLVRDLAGALPSDKRSYRGLRSRIAEALTRSLSVDGAKKKLQEKI